MTISDKTRKLLWGRSGNRCYICKCELVQEATSNDRESIIGDECHIVARESGGPRGSSPLSYEERDEIENLILLCRIHHKIIDDQPNTFNVEWLRQLKTTHEAWVRVRLSETKSNDKQKLFPAYRIDVGKQLIDLVVGASMMRFDQGDFTSQDEADVIGDLSTILQDTLDIWDELGGRERAGVQLQLNGIVDRLYELGLLLYGFNSLEHFSVGGERLKFRFATICVIKQSNNLTQRKDETIEEALHKPLQKASRFTSCIYMMLPE